MIQRATRKSARSLRGVLGHALPILVPHVREGFEDRAASIQAQLDRVRLDFDYMLDGDMVDIDDHVLERWFSGEMKAVSAQTSCAVKHLLCYERMVREEWPAALMLEDDALLTDDFIAVVEGVVAELERDHRLLDPWYVSLENSHLRFVRGADRNRGQYLYATEKGRCTGGYMINLAMARSVLAAAEGGGLAIPIDLFIDELLPRDDVQAFWCEPTVVEQGSHSGVFASSLLGHGKGLVRRAVWTYRKTLRRVKYRFA